MNLRGWKREWTELAIVSVISFFLYQMNMLIVFCIPLQVLYVRRGERELSYGAILVLVALGVLAIFRTSSIEETALRNGILAMETILPSFFIVGVIAVNLRWKTVSRMLFKIMALTGGVGVLSAPLIYLMGKSEYFSLLIESQVELIGQIFAGRSAQIDGGTTVVESLFSDTEGLISLVKGILLRNYLFMYFIIVSGSVWIGNNIAGRTQNRSPRRLATFSVPDWAVWPLLISWAGVLLDMVLDIGILRYIVWNAGMIMLLIYGIQGVGILQIILDNRRIPRRARILIVASIVLLLFWPGVNLFVLIGLPGLGVSKLWIHYKKSDKSEGVE